jgi:hypothetical protein
MTDSAGQKDRPGAGSYSLEMNVEGIPINCYLNHHPQTGKAEVVRHDAERCSRCTCEGIPQRRRGLGMGA